ncbi:MAG: adenosine deaminase [Gammaproteobacteria bacterium]|nr:adenosine deaminase [Gammaproteobacteria bacterium]
MRIRPWIIGLSLTLLASIGNSRAAERWFEELKATATPVQLYTFLYALPKGGDLHNHLGGSARSDWLWAAALAQQEKGYTYYTKVRIENCAGYGTDEFGRNPYLLLFKNLQGSDYEKLDSCQKSEYKRLQDLNEPEHAAWLNSLRLDTPHEGRDEFFEAQWRRIGALLENPYLVCEILYRNMDAFGKEGLAYLETQAELDGLRKSDGSAFTTAEVATIFRQELASPRAKATGVEVRFQYALLRFGPHAEQRLRDLYALVDQYRDLYVGVNMVGREDNAKGYPLRFLPVLRELRKRYPDINLSIHAGEMDEPDFHVRDTLLLGAKRIGHGVNLICDPETMVLMRNGPYMVEINLISNLLLEYVADFSQHPFPEYVRVGIPVALSTDDRGMWDSNLTDEYFVAVHEFNLSWEELVQLGRNSLKFSFVDDPTRQRLLAAYEKRVQSFAQQFRKDRWSSLHEVKPVSYLFMCHHYQICLQ